MLVHIRYFSFVEIDQDLMGSALLSGTFPQNLQDVTIFDDQDMDIEEDQTNNLLGDITSETELLGQWYEEVREQVKFPCTCMKQG